VKCLAVLLVRIAIRQFLTRRASIDIFIGQINKVLLAKAAFRFRARSLRLRQRNGDAALLAGQDLLAVKVAAISHSFELVHMQRGLCCLCRVRKMCRVIANVRHLMRNDQLMLGVDGGLHIVPDDTGPAATRRHRSAIGIGQ